MRCRFFFFSLRSNDMSPEAEHELPTVPRFNTRDLGYYRAVTAGFAPRTTPSVRAHVWSLSGNVPPTSP